MPTATPTTTRQRLPAASLLYGVVLLLLITSPASAAPAGSPFAPRQALAKLGKTKPYSLFALSTRVPLAWTTSSYAAYSDPNHLRRLQVEDRRVATAYRQHYKHPIFVELWLRKPARPAQVLQRWMTRRLKDLVVSGHYQRWRITWQADKRYAYKLAGGRRLLVRMMVGSARPSAYTQPLAVQLCGVLLVHGQHAAVLGTGLASDSTFNSLSLPSRQLVTTGFASVCQQVMLVASLARIKLPARLTSLERRLVRQKRFLHAARYSSQVGTLSRTRFAQFRRLDIRFQRGPKCSVRDDFSSLYQHSQRSLLDAPGAGPRARTGATGASRKWTPSSRFEVRRGSGGQHWLVLHLKAGPTFYTLHPTKTRRCGKKRIRGLAIGGLVEGVYSTWRGWCVHTPAHKAPR